MVRRISVLVLFALLLSLPAFAAGNDLDATIDQVNRAIQAKGAAWHAGRTMIGEMPDADFRMMLGAHPSPLLQRMTPLEPPGGRSLPSHFDWRDQNGVNYITPVKNQGRCGSCVAFGSVGAVEAGVRIRDNNPNLDIDLSEQQAFDCAGGTCADGSDAGSVLSNMASNGVVDEPCFPYMSGGTVYDYNCSDVCSTASSRTFRIAGFQSVGVRTDTIKQALVDNGPLTATMDVYQDLKYYIDGVYQYTWGDYLGGHQILIVGWDDTDGAWIIKNSWTTNFGENGYFRIKWWDCSINLGVTAVDVGKQAYAPGPTPGGDCNKVASEMYDACNLAYDNNGQSLAKNDFLTLCAAGSVPQGVFNCAQEHTDCNMLAACVGFTALEWCTLDLSYVYQSCNLQVALDAAKPLSLTDAVNLCNSTWEYAPSFKCVFDCVPGSATCSDLSTCLAACPFCPFPTVNDFTADVTTSPSYPVTVTFTRNVTIPSNCDPVGSNWQFGDGDYSYANDDVVQHTYLQSGQFTVSLFVANGAGPSTLVKQNYIQVGAENTDDDNDDNDDNDNDDNDDNDNDDNDNDDNDSAVDDDTSADDDDDAADDDQSPTDDDASPGADDDTGDTPNLNNSIGGCGC
jgi:PKD repeat protein